jgi:hypothetical protein
MGYIHPDGSIKSYPYYQQDLVGTIYTEGNGTVKTYTSSNTNTIQINQTKVQMPSTVTVGSILPIELSIGKDYVANYILGVMAVMAILKEEYSYRSAPRAIERNYEHVFKILGIELTKKEKIAVEMSSGTLQDWLDKGNIPTFYNMTRAEYLAHLKEQDGLSK